MQIMALGIACGEKVVVFTKDDCDKARETVDAMADLIGSDFGEIY
jgi:phosphotransferase system HPr-like phosphotransfer protein